MDRIVRYISHPQVVIDPEVPVARWGLSDLGRSRTKALAASNALAGTKVLISSTETKALETAAILANALHADVVTRADMGENDRSATGFLPPVEFEAVADDFFSKPESSVRGWETAVAAQARVFAAYSECLAIYPNADLAFIGHGAVGTLLYCALSGRAIDRVHDQGPGGGGCYWELGCESDRPQNGWQPIEKLFADKP